MDDAGPLGIAAGDPPGEGVDEGAALVSRPRMHDEACRLVDHEHVLVLVRDPRRCRRRGELRRCLLGQLELLTPAEAIALRAGDSVDERTPLLHDGLGLDSLEIAELSVMLEDAFGTDPFTEGSIPATVGDIFAFYDA